MNCVLSKKTHLIPETKPKSGEYHQKHQKLPKFQPISDSNIRIVLVSPLACESFSSKPLHDPFQFRLRWKASRDPLEGAHSWHCRQYFPLLAMNLLGFRTYVVDLGLFIVGIKYTHQHLNPSQ